jgi:hypothetical protein
VYRMPKGQFRPRSGFEVATKTLNQIRRDVR